MEQFRRIGEVLGSLKALMVMHDDIQINQRQCSLLLDIFCLAFDTIADEIRQNLKLEERNTKWKAFENPLRELCRVFREAELYIKHCLDSKDWWGKAITLSHNCDCVELHIHNLLCYFPAVIDAIENLGEISGVDPEEKEKKKIILARKYQMEWNDPKLFQWRFGKQYLVSREMCRQLENAGREDRWRLIEALKENKSLTKNEQQLSDLLFKKLLNGSDKSNKKLLPSAILFGAKDYQVRRRLGNEFKEIHWLGQSFALRHFCEDSQSLDEEVSSLLSLSHPHIMQYLCGFYDDNKREFFLVMELMNKDLWTYVKENNGPRRQTLASIPVVVDLMLQIARGMEYLHSKNMCHGQLNPSNIFLKARNSQEGYFQAKVSGFGVPSVKNDNSRTSKSQGLRHEEINPLIWRAPEVQDELEKNGVSSRYTEKADVYSFAMICFELLTGKVPFEENHQHRSIKDGERPLFPYPSPKYLVSLIKKCWQTDPNQRPSFSSICRILRYTKKFLAINTEFLVINPELNQYELQAPPVDYCDLEATFLNNFPTKRVSHLSSVSQIPHEMFAYRVAEKEKISASIKDKRCESPKEKENQNQNDEQKEVGGDHENTSAVADPLPQAADKKPHFEAPAKKTVTIKIKTQGNTKKEQRQLGGSPKLRHTTSLPIIPPNRSSRINKGNQMASAASHLSPSKTRTSNASVAERNLRINKGGQSRMPSPSRRKRNGDASSSSKTKNGNQSPSTLRRVNTEVDLKSKKGNESPNAISPLSKWTSSEIRWGGSPLSTRPLMPYARITGGHASDSEGSLRRGSFSSLALSPYATRTSGHVSD